MGLLNLFARPKTQPIMENAMPEELIEAARKDHPQVVEELERLRLWVGTCIGADVAAFGGPAVE